MENTLIFATLSCNRSASAIKVSVFILSFAALAACDAPPVPNTDKPSIDAPNTLIVRPDPIVTQTEFLDAFIDLCLVAPHSISTFENTAARLGLIRARVPNQPSLEDEIHAWQTNNGPGEKALRLKFGPVKRARVLDGPIVDETTPWPEMRFCNVTGYIPELTRQEQRDWQTLIQNDLVPRANAVDFSSYSGAYEVKPDDIRIKLALPTRHSYVDLRPNAVCSPPSDCLFERPYRLTLSVVTYRPE